MNRSVAREIAVRVCFGVSYNTEDRDAYSEFLLDEEYYATLKSEDESYSEFPDPAQLEYINRIVNGVNQHITELDQYIEKYSQSRKISRISKIALSVLRVAMFELLFCDDIPTNVSVSEAVEITKKYEEQSVASFVNGLLSSFVKNEINVSADS